MSVDQLPSGRVRLSTRDAQLVGYDQYIDTQIRSTRRMVKAVDIATVLMVMAAGALGFLLAAAVAEHWLVAGGFSRLTRTILFAVFVSAMGYYALRRLWPLCVRPINPVYAAQTIELSSPTLKNSLLNLLLFRQRRSEITDAVYKTLEEQAAQRLVRVPIDAAVDRSHLIRLGYVLVAVVTVAALYKMFSPKDPLVTAERVLMPWTDTVPASRVSITNVEPGTTTLARGEVLQVSADVRGIGDDDPVVVRYTTADGQAVNRPVQLKPTASGLRYLGQIPAAQPGEPGGVAQNLRYRIEAGDARSKDYAVTVIAAPTITVERIDYDYPDYTGFVDRSVDGLGDIRAIEGTRVTIHARANVPIDEAAVDFEADGRRDIQMNVDTTTARTSFLLTLRADRQTPRHTSYALRLTTTDGRRNRDPAKFPIDVLPDYAPEIELLAPREKVRDVRVDESVAIEVEARDPDFALGEVRVRGEVAGRAVFDEPLLAKEHTGRFTGRLLFTPSAHNLQAGDVVRYWAVARDNRTPEPNEAVTEPQTFRIVAPDPDAPQQPPKDRMAQREPGAQQPEDQQQDERPEDQQQPADGQQAEGESDSADGQPSPADSQAGGKADGQPGDDKQNGAGQPGAADQQDGVGDPQQQPGGTDGAGDSRAGASDARPSDDRPPQNGQGEPRDGAGAEREQQEQQQPVSPDGDNDGEAFDRIRRFLERQGKLPEQDDSQPSGRDAQRSPDDQGSRDAKPSDSPDDTGAEDASGRGERRDPTADDTDEAQGAERRPGDPADASQPDEHSSARDEERADDAQSDEGPSPDGQPKSSDGPSGAGDKPQREQGAPDAQRDMKPTDKWQETPSGEKPADAEEPAAGARGKQESDSQGEQGGDRAGGGEEGGGQQAERDGTGSAGQNQSADEGAGESSEQGGGRTSPDAGTDSTADERTGQGGSDQAGRGSEQSEGQEGEPAGRDAQSGASERDPQQSADPKKDPAHDPGGQAGGAATGGGGLDGTGEAQPHQTDATAPEADAANLEYAQEQTDLVLETLAEQMKRKKLDEQLLDELGWSAEDLQRFLDRWRQLKESARDDTPQSDAARRELEDALRSLGLRRDPLGDSQVRQDEMRDLREGFRGPVPLEFQERLRAYNQGVSRARPDEE